MKHFLALSLLMVVVFTTQAQFEVGPPVYPLMPNLNHLSVTDADGDGDNELLSSALIDSRIGTFDVDQNWTRSFTELSSNLNTGNEVFMSSDQIFALDIDNDGDMDLLSLEYSLNRQIVWYERINEEMNRHVIDDVDTGFALTHVDYDQDGDVDVLYNTVGNEEIVLYEQTSAGVFAEAVAIFSILSVQEFVWSDIDQDGDMDLLTAGNYLALFENVDNVLQAPMNLTEPGALLRELEVVDLNNDGMLDLVARNSAPNNLSVYYQSAGLDFSNVLSVNSMEELLSWELFDVNLDGNKDFVIALEIFGEAASLYYYPVDAQGDFGLIQAIEEPGPTNERWQLISGDINDDGVDELIASERDFIDVYQGSADGLVHLVELNGKPSSFQVLIADLNNDGLEDLLFDGQSYSSPEHIAFNDGNGGFRPGDPLTFSPLDIEEHYPNVHDFNNDGLMDVFLYEDWTGTGTILEQTVSGELVPLSTLSSDSWFMGVHSQFGDVNGDGFDDIILSQTEGSSQFEIWLNDEEGVIENSEFNYGVSFDGLLQNHVSGDTNGDGISDFAFITDEGIYLGLGNGSDWDDPILISDQVGDLARMGALIDIEGDGDLDLLVFTVNSCVLLTNDQSNNWPFSMVDLDAPNAYQHFVVSDFDNNGLLDLAHVEDEYDTAEIRLNDGNGGFMDANVVPVMMSPFSIASIDIDGDGDQDLSIGNGNYQRWIINAAEAGCTDPSACNYNENADFDNGVCCYGSCGCTDPSASNYAEDVTCADGSCLYSLTVSVFDDLGLDGSMDGNDYFLGNILVEVEPLGLTFMTDLNGEFSFEVAEGTDLEMSVQTTNIFPFHTTQEPLVLTLPNDYSDDNYLMGLAKLEPIPQIEINVLSPALSGICGWSEQFMVLVENQGNSALNGEVQVQFSELLSISNIPFDHSVLNDSTFTFELSDLAPGAQLYRPFYLEVPGVDQIGEFFQVQTSVMAYSPENTEAVSNDSFEFELTCAYDPNDKRVQPAGYEEPHFIAVDQELEYTVRFQNTGNSPAINVVVEDTISEYLDLSTLDIKGASHNMQVEINEAERLIRFVFPEIMLPDSTCCLEESQGFVAFAMAPLADLADGTEINNDAYIYFDNNEAIITNETWNTIMVCSDEMSAIQSDYDLQICEDTEFEFSNDSPWVEEYLWEFGGEEVSSDSIVTLLTGDPGDEVLVLTTSNPVCESTTELDFEVVINQVNGGFIFDVFENLLSLDGYVSYQWFYSGIPIEGANESEYIATEYGDYTVFVSDQFGCEGFSDELDAGPVSISELDLELVEVFPNPVSDVLSIEFPLDNQANYQVLDSKGSLITSGNLRKGMNTIDMSTLASGMYFLKVDGALESIKVSKK